MTNMDTPMTRREWLLLALFCCVAILGIGEFHEYLSNRVSPPVVFNSLPATPVKCPDFELPGHCTKFNISTKEYEAMQK